MSEPVRLSKRLIELIGCSRREAELYIEGGWVLVDGETVEEPQFKVADQRVELHPDAIVAVPEPATLLVYADANQKLETVATSLKAIDRWPGDTSGIRHLKSHFARLKSCLPLQPGAVGMVVLTQDWQIQRKLTDDAGKLEQEYVVEVSGEAKENSLKRLNQSVSFGGAVLPPSKVSWQNETRLRFAMKNPQPGQIAHLCASVGFAVISMKRIRIGGVSMSKLQPGQWRYLSAKERF